MAKKSSLQKQLEKKFREANLPPDSLIHMPGLKAKGDGTSGSMGCETKPTKEEIAYHKKLNANLNRSRKRKPDFICSE